jgi:GTP diphosphokinase / guanosine-3',5'-bis(diphosphate) 3'-diphosphatase
MNNDILLPLRDIFDALEFSAFKHRRQRRKGTSGIPYINHPIEVARLLLNKMKSPELNLIIAAILHDTLEDTDTSPEEISQRFGEKVLQIVMEVTDDMKLPYSERKNRQVLKANTLSYEARCIKIADKTCNIHDILHSRIWWPKSRKIEYIRWAMRVIKEIQDTHTELINYFNLTVSEAEEMLHSKFLLSH